MDLVGIVEYFSVAECSKIGVDTFFLAVFDPKTALPRPLASTKKLFTDQMYKMVKYCHIWPSQVRKWILGSATVGQDEGIKK